MFVFSDVQDCDYDPKAKEVLVFSNQDEKDSYNPIPEGAYQHNVSLYKIRAVLRSSDDRWIGILKNGRNGYSIYTTESSYSSYEEAICATVRFMLSSIITNTLLVFPNTNRISITDINQKFFPYSST